MQRFSNHCLGLVKKTKYRAKEYLGTIHTARLAILEVTASSSKTSFPSPPDLTSATSFFSSSSFLELFSAFGASSPSASPRSSSWILLACVHCQVRSCDNGCDLCAQQTWFSRTYCLASRKAALKASALSTVANLIASVCSKKEVTSRFHFDKLPPAWACPLHTGHQQSQPEFSKPTPV